MCSGVHPVFLVVGFALALREKDGGGRGRDEPWFVAAARLAAEAGAGVGAGAGAASASLVATNGCINGCINGCGEISKHIVQTYELMGYRPGGYRVSTDVPTDV
jgi:hypothetical protein